MSDWENAKKEFADKLNEYVRNSHDTRTRMQSKLWNIFHETTGFLPEDVCLVEQRITEGTELKTIYYYDLKDNHQPRGDK